VQFTHIERYYSPVCCAHDQHSSPTPYIHAMTMTRVTLWVGTSCTGVGCERGSNYTYSTPVTNSLHADPRCNHHAASTVISDMYR